MLVKVKKKSRMKELGHRLFKTLYVTLNHKTTKIEKYPSDTVISNGK